MPAHVKLLGPDLGSPLLVEVDPGDSIAGLKDRALASWPSGARRLAWPGARARLRSAHSAHARRRLAQELSRVPELPQCRQAWRRQQRSS